MKFVNLTPHEIVVMTDDAKLVIPSSGECRVTVKQQQIWSFKIDTGEIPVVCNTYGDIEGLPPPEENTVYIVSLMVLEALKHKRVDVFAPDSGKTAIRENGKIIAVRQFVGHGE